MTMTRSTTTPITDLDARLTPQVLSFEKALDSTARRPTPAALTEAMLPQLDASRWLMVTSSSMAERNACTAMKLILDRTAARGVSIAFDVNWQPRAWGLEPGASPTAEVRRRIQPLIDAALLIRCSAGDATTFFGSTDPTQIHERLRQRPAVLIRTEEGAIRWCLAGRNGVVPPEADGEGFLESLLTELSARPEILGGSNPGEPAIAAPGEMREMIQTNRQRNAASAGEVESATA